MKNLSFFLFISLLILTNSSFAQDISYKYEPSKEFPFGQINPVAPEQLADFEAMIGECDCTSKRRNPDGTWQDSIKMKWRFKYIMNGMAVQDETLNEAGFAAGSIRMFNPDSSKWYVHYYSSSNAAPQLKSWRGGKVGDKIILDQPQKSPNGMDGISRLTFHDISEKGFKWTGAWVNEAANIVYPFWKIECSKRP